MKPVKVEISPQGERCKGEGVLEEMEEARERCRRQSTKESPSGEAEALAYR